MFGPNKILPVKIDIDFCHRDIQFFEIIRELKQVFKKKFNLNDYKILFVSGSGTTAIESIFFSYKHRIEVVGNEGKFYDRWKKLSKLYNPKKFSKVKQLYCQLETSNSSTYTKDNCFVDGISSFPYYDIPDNTEVFITSSNKILGSIPGCAIVALKKNILNDFIDEEIFSTLNLKRLNKYLNDNQTPATPPVQVYWHLLKTLKAFNTEVIREKINKNSSLIIDSIGKENVIGELYCPVITILKTKIPLDIASKYQLYQINTKSKYYQIFTYSEKNIYYEKLASDLKKM